MIGYECFTRGDCSITISKQEIFVSLFWSDLDVIECTRWIISLDGVEQLSQYLVTTDSSNKRKTGYCYSCALKVF